MALMEPPPPLFKDSMYDRVVTSTDLAPPPTFQRIYRIEYARSGRSTCHGYKCGKLIDKGDIRIAVQYRKTPIDFEAMSPSWFHPTCLFENFLSTKHTRTFTKLIEKPSDLIGLDDLSWKDQAEMVRMIRDFHEGKFGPVPARTQKPQYPSLTTKPKIQEDWISAAGPSVPDDPV
eukprot:TRINITY_DN8974_c0_g1_i1.p1 TRINITY_DN8974_c0_g1~~TRINITY_DN8974_c0_g1_i1.p1  ORF type:complete len:175 (+),score=26.42 TRINITY_DN8974_c0_g1_i1:393-917(+)